MRCQDEGMRKLLVFTDLDGTLLDHKNYSWKKAEPAISLLNELAFPLIINSSKTSSEIINLIDEIGIRHPFISENGSVVNIPNEYFEGRPIIEKVCDFNKETYYFGKPYNTILEILAEIRKNYKFKFTGFSDLTNSDVAENCNLSIEYATLAKQREASEPITWMDTDKNYQRFIELLKAKGLTIQKGGRFHQVMGDVDKGIAIRWLKEKYEQNDPKTEWITVGLGDSFNDIRMLEVVDYPVLVKNQEITQPDMSYLPNLIKTHRPGPEGWNEAVEDLINQYNVLRKKYG